MTHSNRVVVNSLFMMLSIMIQLAQKRAFISADNTHTHTHIYIYIYTHIYTHTHTHTHTHKEQEGSVGVA